MGFSSLQTTVEDHMDSSDWLQGTANEETRMESSPPLGDIMRPITVDKKLRPQQDQPIKCPRCDSTHTKFCYYNNYSLSQPRYFCKTCRRYWTKGGSLRNIPVGGGCRKNKRVSVKKSSSSDHDQTVTSGFSRASSYDGTDLQLSFPREMQFSQLNALLANNGNSFMDGSMIEGHPQFDFLESKFGGLLGNPRNHDFIGNTDLGLMSGFHHDQVASAFHDQFSHYGISFAGNNGHAMLPFDGIEDTSAMEMKPNKQLLSFDWHDHQGYSEVGKESFGYFNGVGSWNGFMNGYGSSATNPLV